MDNDDVEDNNYYHGDVDADGVIDNNNDDDDIVVGEEENNDEEEVVVLGWEEQQQWIVDEALILPVVEMAAAQHRPERNGAGVVSSHKRKQLNNHERALVALYSTHLMGWKILSDLQM